MANAEDGLDLMKKIIQQKDEFDCKYEQIGKGAFGYIYEVVKKSDNQSYALKCIPLEGDSNEIEKLKEEPKNLRDCKHQNIVQYNDSFLVDIELQPDEYSELFSEDEYSEKDSDSFKELLKENSPNKGKIVCNVKVNENKVPKFVSFLCIQMELCEKSLREMIDRNEITDCKVLNGYMKDICEGLKYLHEQELIHRDLKPDNILFCAGKAGKKGGILKIADFGLSKNIMAHECNRPFLTQCGSAIYRAPELFSNTTLKNNKMIDIYSLGVIFLEMNYQFKTRNEFIQAIENVETENYFADLPEEYHFILKLLSKDPEKRPTSEKVMDYLTGMVISKIHLKNYNENRERLQQEFNNDLLKINFENNLIGKVLKTAIQIFELHGGKIFKIPCYYPHRLQSLSILNKFSNVVPIADNFRIVFAKYLYKTRPMNQIRRYSILNNLSNSIDNMYTFRDNMECTFDIVFPNQSMNRQLYISLEAEIICIVLDILNDITNYDNSENIVIHLNHKAFIKGLLHWEDLNTADNIRNIYNLFREYTNENLTITDCINKLKNNDLDIHMSADLISLLTNPTHSSQFLLKLQEYLVENEKYIFENSFPNYFQTAYMKMVNLKDALKILGIKDKNIFLNCSLLHQYEDSRIMFRVYFKKEKELIKIAEGGHYENLILNYPKKNYFACGVSLNIEGIDKALTRNNRSYNRGKEVECALISLSDNTDWSRQMLLLLRELHKHKINAIMSNSRQNNCEIIVKFLNNRIDIFNKGNLFKSLDVNYYVEQKLILDVKKIVYGILLYLNGIS